MHAHAEKHEQAEKGEADRVETSFALSQPISPSQKPSPAVGAAVAAKARPTTVDFTAKPKNDDSAGHTDIVQGLDSPAIDAKAKALPSGHGQVAVTSETQPAISAILGFITQESSLTPLEQVAQKIEHLDHQIAILALQKINHPYAMLALHNTKAFPRMPRNSTLCGESSDSISFNRDSPVSVRSCDSRLLNARASLLAKECEQVHQKIKHLDHQLAMLKSSKEGALPHHGP